LHNEVCHIKEVAIDRRVLRMGERENAHRILVGKAE